MIDSCLHNTVRYFWVLSQVLATSHRVMMKSRWGQEVLLQGQIVLNGLCRLRAESSFVTLACFECDLCAFYELRLCEHISLCHVWLHCRSEIRSNESNNFIQYDMSLYIHAVLRDQNRPDKAAFTKNAGPHPSAASRLPLISHCHMISYGPFESESEPPPLTGWFCPISTVSQKGNSSIIFLTVSLVNFKGKPAAPLKRQDPWTLIWIHKSPATARDTTHVLTLMLQS